MLYCFSLQPRMDPVGSTGCSLGFPSWLAGWLAGHVYENYASFMDVYVNIKIPPRAPFHSDCCSDFPGRPCDPPPNYIPIVLVLVLVF